MKNSAKFIPLEYQPVEEPKMRAQSKEFLARMKQRRTVRHFSDQPVPMEVIENCLRAAGTAPSGANLQPWHFVVVSDPFVKQDIRQAAEEEELLFYTQRAPEEWLEALSPLGTDVEKPFLETAPYLIAVFAQSYGLTPSGKRVKNYYVSESVGIATGILISALHLCGLVTLTHTPSPMGFLNRLLDRPKNERPFLLLVVGYPALGAQVPVITKKSYEQIVTVV